MQCTRCAKTLPEGVSFCLACGFPVNTGAQTPTGNAPMLNRTSTGLPFAQIPTSNMDQAGAESTKSGFVFQEFGATPARPASTPGFTPPGNMPSYPGAMPGFAPPGSMPSYPGAMPGFVPPGNIPPGYPMAAPFPFAPGSQGMYPAPFMPVTAPPKPKRRGRSVGCIILYVFLAIGLLFTGLSVALVTIVSHANANYASTKTAATQLYQQVTSQPATIEDLLAGPVSTNWTLNQQPHYSCELDNTALHLSVDNKGIFDYCKNLNDFSSDIAFQAQMRIISGDGGGLVFRITPSADGSADGFYFFQVNLQGNYEIFMHQAKVTEQVSVLAAGVTQAMDKEPGQTNTITVIARGTLFNLYINQQFVVQFQNSMLTGAMIGVAAADVTHTANVLYTGMELWDLDK